MKGGVREKYERIYRNGKSIVDRLMMEQYIYTHIHTHSEKVYLV